MAEPEVAELHDGLRGIGKATVVLEADGASLADVFLAAAWAFFGYWGMILN